MSLSVQGPSPNPPRPSIVSASRVAPRAAPLSMEPAPLFAPPPTAVDPPSPFVEGTPTGTEPRSSFGDVIRDGLSWLVDKGTSWLGDKLSSLFGTKPAATPRPVETPVVDPGRIPTDLRPMPRPTPGNMPEITTPATTPAGPAADTFAARIGEILKPNAEGLVHESELYAALVYERTSSVAGREAGQAFLGALQSEMQQIARADGYVDVEAAALGALRTLVERDVLTPAQADRIHAESFAAAQLDDNAGALYDDRGSANDPTIATARFDEAIAKARERIAAFDAGSETPPTRPLDDARATGLDHAHTDRANERSGPQEIGDGFLFKPRSESDGDLVILLPPALAGRVEGLRLLGPEGDVVAEGRYTSTANGGRPHFRFDRPGSDFPGPLVVEARLEDGTVRTWSIDDPSQRHE